MKLVAKTDIGSQRSENQDSYRGGAARTTLFGVPCATVWAVRAAAAWPAPWRWMRCSRPSRRVLTRRTPLQARTRTAWKAPWSRPNPAAFMKRLRGTPSLSGMGTTVVCALVRGGLAQYVHVGDSRIYLFRNNKLLQLTKDHSMVQEMVEQGALTEEEAQNHPRKNLITRALGVGRDVEADFGEKEVSPRDILLLCSDGLSNCVSVPQIEETLARTPFYEAADALVQKALEGGGLDNITVLLMQVEAVEENNG